jgi:hypothetical protein
MESYMFDFQLTDEGERELARVGEHTRHLIGEVPVLDEALSPVG